MHIYVLLRICARSRVRAHVQTYNSTHDCDISTRTPPSTAASPNSEGIARLERNGIIVDVMDGTEAQQVRNE